MYIRAFAVIFLILAGASCGINGSEKLKKRRDICLEIEKMLRICENLIRSSGADVYCMMTRLRSEMNRLPFLDSLSGSYAPGSDFHVEWKNAVTKCTELAEDEQQLLIDFGNTLGTCDTEGQLRAIAAYGEAAGELYSRRSSEYASKGRLYRSLGLLAGITLGIIVI